MNDSSLRSSLLSVIGVDKISCRYQCGDVCPYGSVSLMLLRNFSRNPSQCTSVNVTGDETTDGVKNTQDKCANFLASKLNFYI